MPVAEGARQAAQAAGHRRVRHRRHGVDDLGGAGHAREPGGHRLGAFGAVAHHHQRLLEDRDFLLHPAGVGDQHAGPGRQTEERAVVEGRRGPQTPGQRRKAKTPYPLGGAGMHRQQDRPGQVGEGVQYCRELVRVVDILGPVDGRQDESVVLDAVADQQLGLAVRTGHRGERRLDDRVAGDHDGLVGHADMAQVAGIALGGTAVKIGDHADDHAVDLLGHGPVPRPQSGLDVHHR